MQLKTLGGLNLKGSDFRRPKALLLLAYLALEGKQERRHLAELFWLSKDSGLANLSMTLTRLKKALPDVVAADKFCVWTKVQTDVSALDAALGEGDHHQVLTLYQGAFFEGLPFRVLSNELEEWIYEVRESSASKARSAWLHLAEQEASKGDFVTAASHAEKAYHLRHALEPEPNELERLFLLLRSGQNLIANEVAKEAQYYGLALSLTSSEAQRQLQQDSESQESTSYGLPSRHTRFIGRDLELAQVTGLLARPDCPLLTLVGTGGVGKSHLALQFATQQNSFDEVFFVALEALTDVHSIPASITEVIGLELEAEQEPLEELIRFISAKIILLILDNAEHLVEAAPMLGRLLECPNLKLLVTSRERLNLVEEHILSLEGLQYPDTGQALETLEDFNAVELFVERATQSEPSFTLTQDNANDVVDICNYLEGLPLGIELAAVWVKSLSCKEIAEEIKSNLDFLSTSLRNVSERHSSIRAAFEYSWCLLDVAEQRRLRKLSVFQGSFSKDAAKEVAGASFRDLANLIDKSLLQTRGVGKFTLHPVLNQFLYENLDDVPDEKAAAEEAHGLYYLRFIRRHKGGRTIYFRESQFSLTENFANLDRAWTWAIEQNEIEALQASALNLGCHYLPIKLELKLDRLNQTLESYDTKNEVALGYALILQAEYLTVLGLNHDVAKAFAKRSLDLLKPRGERQGVIRGLNLLGFLAQIDAANEQAFHYLSEALALARHYDEAREGELLWRLAFNYRGRGDFNEAVAFMEKSLSELRQRNDDYNATIVATLLGSLLVYTDHIQAGVGHLKEALVMGRKQNHFVLPATYADLARAAYKLDDYAQAEGYLKEALPISQASDILGLFGRVKIAQQAFDEAEPLLKQALELDLNPKHPVLSGLTHTLIFVAELYVARGHNEKAAELLSLVINHSHTERRDKNDACKSLEVVRPSSMSFAAAVERGKASDLETTVRAFLRQEKFQVAHA